MFQPDPTAITSIARQVVATLGSFDPEKVRFSEVETSLRELLATVGRMAVEQIASQVDRGSELWMDGRRWWRAVVSRARRMTVFGEVHVQRGLYRSVRNGPTWSPVDEWMRPVLSFWTEEAAKAALFAMTEFSSRGAAQFFETQGWMKPSRSSLDRLPRGLSDVWEHDREVFDAALREKVGIPEEAAVVAVSLDGVMVNMRDTTRKATLRAQARVEGRPGKGPAGYKEASVGVLTFYDTKGERLASRRFGRMPESHKVTTKDWLRAELDLVRQRRPDLKVVAIADGAPDNWTFLDSLRPDHSIVDFFHTMEHIKRRLDRAIKPSSIQNQKAFARIRKTLLLQPNGGQKAFALLIGHEKAAGVYKPPKGRRGQKTYYQRHHQRMAFREHKQACLPIGSGVTEGTCRHLVVDRLRRTGMRWNLPGGQAVLTFRALRINGQFDDAWGLLSERLAA